MAFLDTNPFMFYLVLYSFYILLPIVPALIIYKIAPKTPIRTTGTLNGVTFKAGGAFAAYVIVALLGFFIIQNAKEQIPKILEEQMKTQQRIFQSKMDIQKSQLEIQKQNTNWKIKAQLKFQDCNTKKILDISEAKDFLESFDVYVDPKVTTKTANRITTNVPSFFIKDQDALLVLNFHQKGICFMNEPIELSTVDSANIDEKHQVINLKEVIIKFKKTNTTNIIPPQTPTIPLHKGPAQPPPGTNPKPQTNILAANGALHIKQNN